MSPVKAILGAGYPSYRTSSIPPVFCKPRSSPGCLAGLWTLLLFLIVSLGTGKGVQPIVSDAQIQGLERKYGSRAAKRGRTLNQRFQKWAKLNELEQLEAVNSFFNQIPYATDQRLFGEADYWQTPLQFLGRYAGDCEDFVIAKYFALRHLGVDEEELFLTYIRATEQRVAHMVLSYFPSKKGMPLILDNYQKKIKPASQRGDLKPVYSFNASSLFLARSTGLGRSLPTDKVKNSKWDKLLIDIQRDKL